MKKIYSKPYIYFEDFQLDASIAAASCSSEAKNTGYKFEKLNSTESTCIHESGAFDPNCSLNLTDRPDTSDPNDKNCYHGPGEVGTGQLFFIYS